MENQQEINRYGAIWEEIMVGVMIILAGILGVSGSQLYNSYYPNEVCSTQAKIQGLWLPNIQYLSNYTGKYICINIDETKSLTELNRVCNHEIGHEIFARECESNLTKCLEMENEK
jgi:hypothetical protein